MQKLCNSYSSQLWDGWLFLRLLTATNSALFISFISISNFSANCMAFKKFLESVLLHVFSLFLSVETDAVRRSYTFRWSIVSFCRITLNGFVSDKISLKQKIAQYGIQIRRFYCDSATSPFTHPHQCFYDFWRGYCKLKNGIVPFYLWCPTKLHVFSPWSELTLYTASVSKLEKLMWLLWQCRISSW